MQRILAFFRNLSRSCYDMEFYREVRVASARKSIRYLAGLCALFVLLGVAQLAPAAVVGRRAAVASLRAKLPAGAMLALKDGRLSTTLPTPFEIGTTDPKAVIDLSYEGVEPRDVPAGALVIGRDALFFNDDGGEKHAAPYAGIPSFSLKKEDALSRVESVPDALIAVAIVLLGLPWFLILFVGTLLDVLLASLLAFAASRFAKLPLGFAQWFSVGCHAITLPIVATALFGPWIAGIPFARSALFLMVIIAVFLDERSNPTGENARVPAPRETQGPPAPEDKQDDTEEGTVASGKEGL